VKFIPGRMQVNLGMALLAAEALGFGTVSAVDAGARERISDIVELEWLMTAMTNFMGAPCVFPHGGHGETNPAAHPPLPAAPAYRGPCQAYSLEASS
jgi:hypothetical protein